MVLKVDLIKKNKVIVNSQIPLTCRKTIINYYKSLRIWWATQQKILN